MVLIVLEAIAGPWEDIYTLTRITFLIWTDLKFIVSSGLSLTFTHNASLYYFLLFISKL